MTTALTELTEAELRSVLRISEAATLVGDRSNAVAADGTVKVHLIRPCVGKGRGRHVYEADMLREHAENGHFNDWPMFVDHESPAAQKLAGGLPRSLRDIGGRVVSTRWDANVPAGGGYDRGAVEATVLPVPWVQDLIRHDPKLANVSINTFATGVKPTTRAGRPAYIVEGFEQDGSADWVTKAGAGGKVVQLLEAAMDDEPGADLTKLMEAMPEDKLTAWLRSTRPAVAEALRTPEPRRGEEENDVDPKELREAIHNALADDDGKALITEALAAGATTAVEEAVRNVLPTAIGSAAEAIEKQVTESVTNTLRLGKIRESAATTVKAAKLPEKVEAGVLKRVALIEAEDTTDDDGKVTETAETAAAALVEAELTEAREMVASLRPTAVTDNGDGSGDDGTGKGKKPTVTEAEQQTSFYRHALQEAGIDVHEAYGVPKPKDDAKPDEEAAA